MANTTAKEALNIHGTNPQFLVEKVIRARIYDSGYWKEHCFALTAESLIDKAINLTYIGGSYGLQKPTPFLCLVLKLLQLQPEKEILLEYLQAEEFKYLRAVAALYIRLTFRSVEVYELLEPLLNDYRKLRYRHMSGSYEIQHMDTFIDSLLREERVCELILPRLTRRDVLEETEGLPPRVSKLEDVLLLGKDGLGAVDAVESPRFRARRDSASGSDASDDSAAEERRERKRRAEKAARIRAQREADAQAQEEIMLGNGGETAMDLDGVESDAGYRSQESDAEDVNGRYRSRSRSVSADRAERFVSRSPSRSRSPEGGSPEGDDDDNGTGYRSRSASRSPDRSPVPDTGYRSRSVSRSPDRF